ncbi:hypothetical protein HD597_000776 [Nonomuraea thailandensis]|uniref:Uncharacterized protein n=1 Tax=Nonomuraea thailandensis TaxID=1188745 RepID=A0A9X2K1P5_9ACTN|nr:hypothetical protein [Nonomuraea thailandensis]MCP2353756.1 hypothetical protein [Nonomuraea thailandensis]
MRDRNEHAVKRTTVVSLLGFTAGILVAGALLGVSVVRTAQNDADATFRTIAAVHGLYVDDDDKVVLADLAWTDARGRAHVTVVQTGEDQALELNDILQIRADPLGTGELVFPLRDAFPYPGDQSRLALLVVLVSFVVMLLALAVRLQLNLRAARAPERSWRATSLQVGFTPFGRLRPNQYATYLVLLSESDDKARWVQRMYWDPAVDHMRANAWVKVRMGTGLTRRAVVILPDGTRLWPAGSLRSGFPWRWDKEGRRRPATVRYRLPRPLLVFIGVAGGAGPLWLDVGPSAACAMGALMGAGMFYAWGWFGGEPVYASRSLNASSGLQRLSGR